MAKSAHPHGSPRTGAVLVLGSAVAFSLTGTLTKAIAADAWAILCWRGLIGALVMTAYAVRFRDRTRPHPLRLGWRGWLLASVGSASSIAFISAFKLTYVANVVVVYATVPFAAAALEWLIRGEPPRRHAMISAAIATAGVVIMVGGGLGAGHLAGDLLAVAMTAGNALYMVLIRRFRDTPAVLAGAVSSVQLFVLGWLVGDPLAISAADARLLVVFGLAFALAVILWTEGTRMIPAADAGLLGAADIPLATLFAWLLLAELPPGPSFLGGVIVLAALLFFARRNPTRRHQ